MWDNLLVEGFYDSPFLWVPINWSNIALIWSEADILRPRCQSEIGNLSSMSDVPWLSDETKLTVKNPCRHICRNFCSIGFTFQEGQKWLVDIRPAGSSQSLRPLVGRCRRFGLQREHVLSLLQTTFAFQCHSLDTQKGPTLRTQSFWISYWESSKGKYRIYFGNCSHFHKSNWSYIASPLPTFFLPNKEFDMQKLLALLNWRYEKNLTLYNSVRLRRSGYLM